MYITSCLAPQEFCSILWNSTVHYSVHKNWSLSWSRSIPSIPPHPTYLRSILIPSTQLRLDLPNGLFPSGFTTIMHSAFPHACYMSCHSRSLSLDHSNYVSHEIYDALHCDVFLQTPIISSLFWPNIFFSISFSNTLSLRYVSPLMSETKFQTIQNHMQNYIIVYSNFYIFTQQTRRQYLWTG
jgi:hypothetical protein